MHVIPPTLLWHSNQVFKKFFREKEEKNYKDENNYMLASVLAHWFFKVFFLEYPFIFLSIRNYLKKKKQKNKKKEKKNLFLLQVILDRHSLQ